MDVRRGIRGGFTLLEILLVVVIIGISAAVAVPTFARSFRGAKLRASARTVLGMHRNAQNKAILGQRYVAILFDQRKGTLEMVDQGNPERKTDAFFGDVGGGGTMGDVATGGAAPPESSAPPTVSSLTERRLEDGVKILSFRGGKEIDDLYYVNYFPNGMCEPFEIRLADDENRTTSIRVDGVTGRAKVERE